MEITIKRVDATDHGIFGHLDVDGFSCVTLERHDISIPTGSYNVTLYDSPAHGYKVPLLHDVPGRSSIEIHPGNFEFDSKGCILVGTCRDGFAIDASRKAFESLMAKLLAATDIKVTIT